MTGTFTEQAKAAASDFRRQHHLGNAPIADLITVLEGVPNVHVAIEPATDGDQHGIRVSDAERGVTILGASATPYAVRLRSTLAHELGHHLFNDPTPAVFSENTPEENRATEFARHLLVPTEGLIDLLGQPGDIEVTDAVLSKVVERFAVSPHMAAIQLREAAFIDAATADRLTKYTTQVLATRYGWIPLYRLWSRDSNQPRPPRRIVATAIDAYLGNDTTVAVVANLQGMKADDMKTELDAAGVIPPPPPPTPEIIDIEPDEDEPVDWSALDNWKTGHAEDETR